VDYRLKDAIVGTAVFFGFSLVLGYLAWFQYLSFHSSTQSSVWNWDSFDTMVFYVFLSGLCLGLALMIIQLQLKDEIKRELKRRKEKKLNLGNKGVILEKDAFRYIPKVHSSKGKLVLTKERLVYTPAGIEIDGEQISGEEKTIIELKDIKDISKNQTLLGLSREVWISCRDGHLERFIMWRRDKFIEAVKSQMKNNG